MPEGVWGHGERRNNDWNTFSRMSRPEQVSPSKAWLSPPVLLTGAYLQFSMWSFILAKASFGWTQLMSDDWEFYLHSLCKWAGIRLTPAAAERWACAYPAQCTRVHAATLPPGSTSEQQPSQIRLWIYKLIVVSWMVHHPTLTHGKGCTFPGPTTSIPLHLGNADLHTDIRTE